MSENCARPDCELPVVARVSEDDQFGRTQTTPTCQDHLDWMMFGLVAPTVDVIEQVSIRRGDQMTTTTTRSECAHNGCDRPVVARILEGDQRVWAVCQDHVVALVSHPPAQTRRSPSTRPSALIRRRSRVTGSGNCCI